MDGAPLSTSFEWSFPTSPHFIKEIIIGIILVICLGIPINVATEYPHVNVGSREDFDDEDDWKSESGSSSKGRRGGGGGGARRGKGSGEASSLRAGESSWAGAGAGAEAPGDTRERARPLLQTRVPIDRASALAAAAAAAAAATGAWALPPEGAGPVLFTRPAAARAAPAAAAAAEALAHRRDVLRARARCQSADLRRDAHAAYAGSAEAAAAAGARPRTAPTAARAHAEALRRRAHAEADGRRPAPGERPRRPHAPRAPASAPAPPRAPAHDDAPCAALSFDVPETVPEEDEEEPLPEKSDEEGCLIQPEPEPEPLHPPPPPPAPPPSPPTARPRPRVPQAGTRASASFPMTSALAGATLVRTPQGLFLVAGDAPAAPHQPRVARGTAAAAAAARPAQPKVPLLPDVPGLARDSTVPSALPEPPTSPVTLIPVSPVAASDDSTGVPMFVPPQLVPSESEHFYDALSTTDTQLPTRYSVPSRSQEEGSAAYKRPIPEQSRGDTEFTGGSSPEKSVETTFDSQQLSSFEMPCVQDFGHTARLPCAVKMPVDMSEEEQLAQTTTQILLPPPRKFASSQPTEAPNTFPPVAAIPPPGGPTSVPTTLFFKRDFSSRSSSAQTVDESSASRNDSVEMDITQMPSFQIDSEFGVGDRTSGTQTDVDTPSSLFDASIYEREAITSQNFATQTSSIKVHGFTRTLETQTSRKGMLHHNVVSNRYQVPAMDSSAQSSSGTSVERSRSKFVTKSTVSQKTIILSKTLTEMSELIKHARKQISSSSTEPSISKTEGVGMTSAELASIANDCINRMLGESSAAGPPDGDSPPGTGFSRRAATKGMATAGSRVFLRARRSRRRELGNRWTDSISSVSSSSDSRPRSRLWASAPASPRASPFSPSLAALPPPPRSCAEVGGGGRAAGARRPRSPADPVARPPPAKRPSSLSTTSSSSASTSTSGLSLFLHAPRGPRPPTPVPSPTSHLLRPASRARRPASAPAAADARRIEHTSQVLFRRSRQMVWRLTNQSRAFRNRVRRMYFSEEAPAPTPPLLQTPAPPPPPPAPLPEAAATCPEWWARELRSSDSSDASARGPRAKQRPLSPHVGKMRRPSALRSHRVHKSSRSRSHAGARPRSQPSAPSRGPAPRRQGRREGSLDAPASARRRRPSSSDSTRASSMMSLTSTPSVPTVITDTEITDISEENSCFDDVYRKLLAPQTSDNNFIPFLTDDNDDEEMSNENSTCLLENFAYLNIERILESRKFSEHTVDDSNFPDYDEDVVMTLVTESACEERQRDREQDAENVIISKSRQTAQVSRNDQDPLLTTSDLRMESDEGLNTREESFSQAASSSVLYESRLLDGHLGVIAEAPEGESLISSTESLPGRTDAEEKHLSLGKASTKQSKTCQESIDFKKKYGESAKPRARLLSPKMEVEPRKSDMTREPSVERKEKVKAIREPSHEQKKGPALATHAKHPSGGVGEDGAREAKPLRRYFAARHLRRGAVSAARPHARPRRAKGVLPQVPTEAAGPPLSALAPQPAGDLGQTVAACAMLSSPEALPAAGKRSASVRAPSTVADFVSSAAAKYLPSTETCDGSEISLETSVSKAVKPKSKAGKSKVPPAPKVPVVPRKSANLPSPTVKMVVFGPKSSSIPKAAPLPNATSQKPSLTSGLASHSSRAKASQPEKTSTERKPPQKITPPVSPETRPPVNISTRIKSHSLPTSRAASVRRSQNASPSSTMSRPSSRESSASSASPSTKTLNVRWNVSSQRISGFPLPSKSSKTDPVSSSKKVLPASRSKKDSSPPITKKGSESLERKADPSPQENKKLGILSKSSPASRTTSAYSRKEINAKQAESHPRHQSAPSSAERSTIVLKQLPSSSEHSKNAPLVGVKTVPPSTSKRVVSRSPSTSSSPAKPVQSKDQTKSHEKETKVQKHSSRPTDRTTKGPTTISRKTYSSSPSGSRSHSKSENKMSTIGKTLDSPKTGRPKTIEASPPPTQCPMSTLKLVPRNATLSKTKSPLPPSRPVSSTRAEQGSSRSQSPSSNISDDPFPRSSGSSRSDSIPSARDRPGQRLRGPSKPSSASADSPPHTLRLKSAPVSTPHELRSSSQKYTSVPLKHTSISEQKASPPKERMTSHRIRPASVPASASALVKTMRRRSQSIDSDRSISGNDSSSSRLSKPSTASKQSTEASFVSTPREASSSSRALSHRRREPPSRDRVVQRLLHDAIGSLRELMEAGVINEQKTVDATAAVAVAMSAAQSALGAGATAHAQADAQAKADGKAKPARSRRQPPAYRPLDKFRDRRDERHGAGPQPSTATQPSGAQPPPPPPPRHPRSSSSVTSTRSSSPAVRPDKRASSTPRKTTPEAKPAKPDQRGRGTPGGRETPPDFHPEHEILTWEWVPFDESVAKKIETRDATSPQPPTPQRQDNRDGDVEKKGSPKDSMVFKSKEELEAWLLDESSKGNIDDKCVFDVRYIQTTAKSTHKRSSAIKEKKEKTLPMRSRTDSSKGAVKVDSKSGGKRVTVQKVSTHKDQKTDPQRKSEDSSDLSDVHKKAFTTVLKFGSFEGVEESQKIVSNEIKRGFKQKSDAADKIQHDKEERKHEKHDSVHQSRTLCSSKKSVPPSLYQTVLTAEQAKIEQTSDVKSEDSQKETESICTSVEQTKGQRESKSSLACSSQAASRLKPSVVILHKNAQAVRSSYSLLTDSYPQSSEGTVERNLLMAPQPRGIEFGLHSQMDDTDVSCPILDSCSNFDVGSSDDAASQLSSRESQGATQPKVNDLSEVFPRYCKASLDGARMPQRTKPEKVECSAAEGRKENESVLRYTQEGKDLQVCKTLVKLKQDAFKVGDDHTSPSSAEKRTQLPSTKASVLLRRTRTTAKDLAVPRLPGEPTIRKTSKDVITVREEKSHQERRQAQLASASTRAPDIVVESVSDAHTAGVPKTDLDALPGYAPLQPSVISLGEHKPSVAIPAIHQQTKTHIETKLPTATAGASAAEAEAATAERPAPAPLSASPSAPDHTPAPAAAPVTAPATAPTRRHSVAQAAAAPDPALGLGSRAEQLTALVAALSLERAGDSSQTAAPASAPGPDAGPAPSPGPGPGPGNG